MVLKLNMYSVHPSCVTKDTKLYYAVRLVQELMTNWVTNEVNQTQK